MTIEIPQDVIEAAKWVNSYCKPGGMIYGSKSLPQGYETLMQLSAVLAQHTLAQAPDPRIEVVRNYLNNAISEFQNLKRGKEWNSAPLATELLADLDATEKP